MTLRKCGYGTLRSLEDRGDLARGGEGNPGGLHAEGVLLVAGQLGAHALVVRLSAQSNERAHAPAILTGDREELVDVLSPGLLTPVCWKTTVNSSVTSPNGCPTMETAVTRPMASATCVAREGYLAR